jgi:hypothetical protein
MDLHLKDEIGGHDYVPYVSLDPLKDPKSFTFRIKVKSADLIFEFKSLKVRGTKLHMNVFYVTFLISSMQVRDLGIPKMDLLKLTVASKKATFAMS